ncbi:MFS transporter [Nocardioides panaciterrulae]|uniref:MFS family permease n=1 Tax=Nocardioides panaciterrulae TaxID=661492 RepID=A0A7Y9JCE6_9ACTN|nr:MFS transporter [Nocardioides panaciterrulae]NYD43915.1 MFS family permease [Nocardioides panaciterrulae]
MTTAVRLLGSRQLAALDPGERAGVRRLAFTRLVTELGTRAAFVALVLRAQALTSSATAVSFALALTVVVDALATPLAGVAGDRWNRRRVMVVSDLCAAALYLLLAGTTDFAAFVAVAAVAVAVESFYFPAAGAALPNLVRLEHLGTASAMVSQYRLVGTIAGPVVAGLIAAAADVRWVFVLDAATFLAAAWMVSGLRGSFQASRDAGPSPEEVTATFFSLLARFPQVPTFMLLWVVIQLGAGLLWVGLPGLARELDTPTIGYPTLLTLGSVGSLAGATLAVRLFKVATTRRLLVIALACQGGFLLVTSCSPHLVIAAVAVIGFRMGESISGTSAFTAFQTATPDAVRARASAWVDTATIAAFGVGVAAGGPVVDHLGARWCFVLAALAALTGCAVAAWLTGPRLAARVPQATSARLP